MEQETNPFDKATEAVRIYERSKILWEMLAELTGLKPGCTMGDMVGRLKQIQEDGEDGYKFFAAVVKSQAEKQSKEIIENQ